MHYNIVLLEIKKDANVHVKGRLKNEIEKKKYFGYSSNEI